jgi:hypothetical protein
MSAAVLGLTAGSQGCNDDGGSGAFDSNSGGSSSSAGASMTGASSQASDSASSGTTDDATTGNTGGSSGGSIKLDVGSPEGGFDGCGCELTYIWISNAEQSTVSKINTRTLEEEGRYWTREDHAGNPSRTSVSLSGDVAVANRHGGLTKFYADPDKCQDTNGMPGIQTSTGASDILAWDMEECRAWHTEFPTTNQRPVAWTPGNVTPGTCESSGEQIWTVGSETPGLPGTGGPGGVYAWLVNGDTGEIEEEILIPEFSGAQLGAYGGAVDGDGNLYFTPMGGLGFGIGTLVRVNKADLTYDTWDFDGIGSYGITVDHLGKVWVSSILPPVGVARFDPDTATWDKIQGFTSAGGLAEGPNNMVWVASTAGANSIDIQTLELGPVFPLVGGGDVKGISVDSDGYVWAVDQAAHKFNPENGVEVDAYNGLTGPYTYSDMTGGALGAVTCPPAG